MSAHPEPSTTRFATISIDPPWNKQQKGDRGAGAHYELMPVDAIKAMPIADLAMDNAHLWLWVTNATLRDGYDVMGLFADEGVAAGASVSG